MSDEQTLQKPVPQPTADTEAFWEGCAHGELRYQQCGACGQVQFYPRPMCTGCQSTNVHWRVSAGRGSLHSYTIVHRPPTPAFKADVPYVIALVDLVEGFRMMMNVRDCDHAALHVGMPVEVFFEPIGNDDQKLPQARPA